MEIKDSNIGTLEDKFVHTAVVGDVIKVHYININTTYYYLVIRVKEDIHLFNLENNTVIDYVGRTLRELYHDAFVKSTGSEVIDSLEVYKDSVLTVK